MKIIDWLKDFFGRHEVQAKVEVKTPWPDKWPFPAVLGTPSADFNPRPKKKPTVKKATTRIVKDKAIKSMTEKPAPVKNKTAAKAASKKKKATK
jgi:hypothetical protein